MPRAEGLHRGASPLPLSCALAPRATSWHGGIVNIAEIVERLRARVANLSKATDTADVVPAQVYAPPSTEAVAAVERRLGVELPAPLRAVYQHVGDGGFGPAYGLLGLVDGAKNEDGLNAVGVYESFIEPDPDDPHWQWPTGLLPVVHLGCAMFFCVRCDTPDGDVVWFEPNAHVEGMPWDDTLFPLSMSILALLEQWLDGVDTLTMMEAAFDAKQEA